MSENKEEYIPFSKEIFVNLTGTNFKDLMEQKQTLLEVINSIENPEYVTKLTGILHWIDDIQDQASEIISEYQVFGELIDE
jgi:hypothetical protein